MYAQLGDIVFELAYGFETYDNALAANYAEHALITNKARLQRTGTGLEEITFALNLHAGFCNPDSEYQRLKAAWENGDVLPLLWGTGEMIGDFVILSLKRSIQKTDSDGFVIWSKVDCVLKEYTTPDKEAAKAEQARKTAFATSLRPAQTNPTIFSGNPAQQLMNAVGSAERDFSYVESGIDLYDTGQWDTQLLEDTTSERMTFIDKALQTIEDIHNAYNRIQGAAADLLVYVQDVRDAVTTIQSMLPITNVSTFRTAVVAGVTGMKSVRSGSAGVAGLLAGRVRILN